jgi:hypothetical protein
MIMAMTLRDQRPFENPHDLEDFVAELTEAAYPVALQHKGNKDWLDLELNLWQTLAQTVKTWHERQISPLSK